MSNKHILTLDGVLGDRSAPTRGYLTTDFYYPPMHSGLDPIQLDRDIVIGELWSDEDVRLNVAAPFDTTGGRAYGIADYRGQKHARGFGAVLNGGVVYYEPAFDAFIRNVYGPHGLEQHQIGAIDHLI